MTWDTLSTRLKRLETRFPLERKPDPIPARFVQMLADWPSECLIAEKDYSAAVAEVTDHRAEEIRAVCRTIANRIRRGEISTINDVYRNLPVEALTYLDELRKLLEQFNWRVDDPDFITECRKLIQRSDRRDN